MQSESKSNDREVKWNPFRFRKIQEDLRSPGRPKNSSPYTSETELTGFPPAPLQMYPRWGCQ